MFQQRRVEGGLGGLNIFAVREQNLDNAKLHNANTDNVESMLVLVLSNLWETKVKVNGRK